MNQLDINILQKEPKFFHLNKLNNDYHSIMFPQDRYNQSYFNSKFSHLGMAYKENNFHLNNKLNEDIQIQKNIYHISILKEEDIIVGKVYMIHHYHKIQQDNQIIKVYNKFHSILYIMDMPFNKKHIYLHPNITKVYINLMDLDKHIMYHYNMNQEDNLCQHINIHSISYFMDKMGQHNRLFVVYILNQMDK